jgi:hypothetical protein
MRSNYSNLRKTYDTGLTSFASINGDKNTAELYNIIQDGTKPITVSSNTDCVIWLPDGNPVQYRLDSSTQSETQTLTCKNNYYPANNQKYATLSCQKNGDKEGITSPCCPNSQRLGGSFIFKDSSGIYCADDGDPAPLLREIPRGSNKGVEPYNQFCQGLPQDQVAYFYKGIDTCWGTCDHHRCDDYTNQPVGFKNVWNDYSDPLSNASCSVAGWAPICARALPDGIFGTPQPNLRTDKKYGCQSSRKSPYGPSPDGDDPLVKACSSSHHEEKVANWCYYDDQCKGYYGDTTGSWFVSSDAEPNDTDCPPDPVTDGQQTKNRWINFTPKLALADSKAFSGYWPDPPP